MNRTQSRPQAVQITMQYSNHQESFVHRVDMFSTNSNSTILQYLYNPGKRTYSTKWSSNQYARNEKMIIAPFNAHLVIQVAMEQTFRNHRKGFIMQASALVEVERLKIGKPNTILLCETHPSDSINQTEKIDSGFLVTVLVMPCDLTNYEAEAGRILSLENELEQNVQILKSITYKQITQDIFQRVRFPDDPDKKYSVNGSDLEKSCIAVDWVGSCALPHWYTGLTNSKMPSRFSATFTSSLAQTARVLVATEVSGDADLVTENWLRLLQVATQLYVNSFPYLPDRKYTRVKGACNTSQLTSTEVFMDPLLYNNADCEDLGELSAELATEIIRTQFPKDLKERVRPEVCWIYQEPLLGESGMVSSEGMFHGTCFIFYTDKRGKRKWLGLDGVNPRNSTRNGSDCNEMWAALHSLNGFSSTFTSYDLRYELWDQTNDKTDERQWPSGIHLMQSFTADGKLVIYHSPALPEDLGHHPMQYVRKMRDMKLSSSVINSDTVTVPGAPLTMVSDDPDKITKTSTTEPAQSAGLWMLKPKVFPATGQESVAFTLNECRGPEGKLNRITVSPRKYLCRIVFNPPTLPGSDNNNSDLKKATEMFEFLCDNFLVRKSATGSFATPFLCPVKAIFFYELRIGHYLRSFIFIFEK